MSRIKKILFFLLGGLFVISACSDERNPVTVGTHPEGWVDAASANWHGLATANYEQSQDNCQSCHGADYNGGSSGVSCYTCHGSYPHMANWSSPNNHGRYLLDETGNISDCQSCHGEDYSGGSSGVSCYTCHALFPHPDRYRSGHADDMENIYWQIGRECQSCHGNTYNGNGYSAKNCNVCHIEAAGPADCRTCHGNDDNAAPPLDRWDNQVITAVGVGFHQEHLSDGGAQDCENCHNAVVQLSSPGHLDDTVNDPGDVVFRNLAVAHEASPTWNHDEESCGGTYCHGGFVFRKADAEERYKFAYTEETITGSTDPIKWTEQVIPLARCGSCHGMPPTGHLYFANCSACHPTVNSSNEIIRPDLHINGEKDMLF
jgi:hypothetical protein